jgi:hypothetical protein
VKVKVKEEAAAAAAAAAAACCEVLLKAEGYFSLLSKPGEIKVQSPSLSLLSSTSRRIATSDKRHASDAPASSLFFYFSRSSFFLSALCALWCALCSFLFSTEYSTLLVTFSSLNWSPL